MTLFVNNLENYFFGPFQKKDRCPKDCISEFFKRGD